MHSKAVFMLSNFASAYLLQKVKGRQKGLKKSESVNCPHLVKLYKDHIGGVDIMDKKKLHISLITDIGI